MLLLKRKIFVVFGLAWGLNLIWEYAHHFLYYLPNGEEMGNYMLGQASFRDALIITGLAIIFWQVKYLNDRPWLIVVCGVGIAVILEMHAIAVGRWAYNELMPIIPIIKTGLSPILQLGLTGIISFYLADFNKK